MKSVFVVYGATWLAVIGCFALGFDQAWWAMLIAAVGSLWFLVFGTVSSVIQIVLLVVLALRSR